MGNCIGPMQLIMTLRLLILLLIIESSLFQLEVQLTHGQLCWIPKTGKTSWLIYTPILSYASDSDLFYVLKAMMLLNFDLSAKINVW